jgi:hypothetical protein
MKEYIVSNDDLYAVEMRRFDELKELIHCRDCIHFKPFVENDGMWCDMLEIDLGENGFCSYGERKDNG